MAELSDFFSRIAAGYYFLGSQWLIGGRQSILSHMEKYSITREGVLASRAMVLPDEPFYRYPDKGYFEPGSCDLIHHSVEADEAGSRALFESFTKAVTKPSPSSWSALYRLMNRYKAYTYSRGLYRMIYSSNLDKAQVSNLGSLLVEYAVDREPVKYGLTLLGFSRSEKDRRLLVKLGRHEEFTFFSSFALSRSGDDTVDLLVELARSVSGWGRLGVVRQIIRAAATRHDLREWILREGSRGHVSTVQLAVECAIGGGLSQVLEDGNIDDTLFESMCRLFVQLADTTDLFFAENFRGASEVTEQFLSLLSIKAADLYHLHLAVQMKFYLEAVSASPLVKREQTGWSVELCRKCLGRCDEIVLRTWWFDQIMAAVRGGNFADYLLASQLASILAIDLHKWHWLKLIAFRHDPYSRNWLEFYQIFRNVVETAGSRDMTEVVTYAEITIPLNVVTDDPMKKLSTEELNKWFNSLNCLTSALGAFPGMGWEVISAALSSPIIALRITAVNTLLDWEMEPLPGYIVRAVKKAIQAEEHLDLIQRMERLISCNLQK